MSSDCHRTYTVVSSALLGLLLAGNVGADGFRNPPDGAAVLGRGGARFTRADDASSVLHNPANLVDLEEHTATVSLSLANRRHEFRSPLGPSQKSDDPWHPLPTIAATWVPEDSDCRVGVALNVPYGQSTRWDSQGLFKYVAPHKAEMFTFQLSPSVATRLGDRISVGAGVNLLQSDLELQQILPWALISGNPAAPDSLQTFDGSGYGFGANVGVTVQVTERQRLAVTYRTPVEVDYDGDFRMDNTPPAAVLPPVLGGLSAGSDFETSIEFPATVGLGYGARLSETLHVEAFVEWVGHSAQDELDLDIGRNNALLVAVQGGTAVPQDWDDTWVYGIGADWALTESFTLRGGYTHVPSPVPSNTLNPTIPIADQEFFAVGLGWKTGEGQRLDLGYTVSFFEDRTIRNNNLPAFNGCYETDQQLVLLSYTIGL